MTAPGAAAPQDSILIIDFGSQVTQLIARRLRETGVYCEIHPFNRAAEAFAAMRPKGVIFSGGPASVTEEGSPRAPKEVLAANVPILAICSGPQTLAAPVGRRGRGGPARRLVFGQMFFTIGGTANDRGRAEQRATLQSHTLIFVHIHRAHSRNGAQLPAAGAHRSGRTICDLMVRSKFEAKPHS